MAAAAEHREKVAGQELVSRDDAVRAGMGLGLGIALGTVVATLVILTVGNDAFPAIPNAEASAPYYVGQ